MSRKALDVLIVISFVCGVFSVGALTVAFFVIGIDHSRISNLESRVETSQGQNQAANLKIADLEKDQAETNKVLDQLLSQAYTPTTLETAVMLFAQGEEVEARSLALSYLVPLQSYLCGDSSLGAIKVAGETKDKGYVERLLQNTPFVVGLSRIGESYLQIQSSKCS